MTWSYERKDIKIKEIFMKNKKKKRSSQKKPQAVFEIINLEKDSVKIKKTLEDPCRRTD